MRKNLYVILTGATVVNIIVKTPYYQPINIFHSLLHDLLQITLTQG